MIYLGALALAWTLVFMAYAIVERRRMGTMDGSPPRMKPPLEILRGFLFGWTVFVFVPLACLSLFLSVGKRSASRFWREWGF